MSIGPIQIIAIIGLIVLLFGASRLPNLGKSLGQAIRGFKKGLSEDEIDVTASQDKIKQDEKKS